jgi:ABC-2 type transport system ATP-binding protein
VDAPLIEIRGLTKRYGKVLAVDDVSFAVPAGRVTGFVGPNGAGKTTTLRAVLGLVRPTAGTTEVLGRPFRALDRPAAQVGAVLETASFHPGRSGRNHLRVVAAAAGIPSSRVDEVLRLVELEDAARLRVKGYSLGMRQRLCLATALLGEPQVLVLDEPANGLDPEGIRWLRGFLRRFAAEGRGVLVSSHVLAELAQTADDVVILNKGRVVAQASLEELTARAGASAFVRSPDAGRLAEALRAGGIEAREAGDGALAARAAPERVGELAAQSGIVLHELRPETSSLEEIFLELTGGEEARPG